MSVTPELPPGGSAPTGIVPPLRRRRVGRRIVTAAVAVVIVLGVGIPLTLRAVASSGTIAPENLYRVGYGNVVQTASTAGTMEIPTSVNLSFQGSGGMLTQLSASVGQTVTAGQVLGRVNDAAAAVSVQQAQASVAQARANVASARANVASARANLAKTKEPPTAADLAVYRSAVAKAEVALAGGKQQYADQKALYNDRLSEEEEVVDARHALAQAQQQAATAAADTSSVQSAQMSVLDAQAAVASDDAAQQTAETNLATAKAGLAAAENTSAQQQAIKTAEVQLSAAQEQLTLAETNLASDQTAAKAAETQYGSITYAQVLAAFQQYNTVVQEYDSWQNQGFVGNNPYAATMQADDTEYTQLDQGYEDVLSANSAVNQAQGTVTSDQSSVAQAQSSVTQDEAALQTAENQAASDAASVTNDETTVAQDQANITTAQAQVADDEKQLHTARTQMSDTEAADALEVKQDEQTLKLAEAGYNDRTSALQALNSSANALQQDEVSLQSAKATLAQEIQPPDAPTVAVAQASIKTAQASLKSSLASLQSAEASLHSAELTDSETVLTSPVSGVVAQVNYTVGEMVGGASPVVVVDGGIQDDSLVQLEVSESQIGEVRVGEPVTVTATALPGDTFAGTITQIYPIPATVSNVTEYTVIAHVRNPRGELRAGMTVNASIQTASASHVIVVPAVSLVQIGSVEGVYVVGPANGAHSGKAKGFGGKFHFAGGNGYFGSGKNFSGKNFSGKRTGAGGSGFRAGAATRGLPAGVYFQPVQLGLFGATDVQITAGLTAGEQILLVPPGSATTATGAGPTAAGHGFGFGGGGGFFGR